MDSFRIQNECHDQTVRNAIFIYYAKLTQCSGFYFHNGGMCSIPNGCAICVCCVRAWTACLCNVYAKQKQTLQTRSSVLTMLVKTSNINEITCSPEVSSFFGFQHIVVWIFVQIFRISYTISNIYGKTYYILFMNLTIFSWAVYFSRVMIWLHKMQLIVQLKCFLLLI